MNYYYMQKRHDSVCVTVVMNCNQQQYPLELYCY